MNMVNMSSRRKCKTVILFCENVAGDSFYAVKVTGYNVISSCAALADK